VKSPVIATLAVVLCGCSSSDFHPYVGQQQKWPTSPGTFVDSQYDVPVYYGYPARPYSVVGMMEETSHGRHSNAVADVAEEAKKLGADPVMVESTETDSSGRFTLQFPKKRPGERVRMFAKSEGVVNDVQLDLVLPANPEASPLEEKALAWNPSPSSTDLLRTGDRRLLPG